MQHMIPEAQYNALYLLAGGLPVEEVWAEVAQYVHDVAGKCKSILYTKGA